MDQAKATVYLSPSCFLLFISLPFQAFHWGHALTNHICQIFVSGSASRDSQMRQELALFYVKGVSFCIDNCHWIRICP